jgi:hypothetical protein
MIDQVPRNKLPQFFGEVLRVLVPGGYLRVGVMDLRALAQRYVAGTIDANRFIEVIGMASLREIEANPAFASALPSV